MKIQILDVNKIKNKMKASFKQVLVNILPPILRSVLAKNRWKGNYHSWEDANSKATGYNSEEILKKVRESSYKVKIGDSKYERDSVLFNEIQYSWPLLAGLMTAGAKLNGKIHVLDFGGSLGSSYYQNKKFLDHFNDVVWCIVEQQHFIEIGKEDFEDERLKFYLSVEDCLKEQSINILILSSVIQYIEKPYTLLKDLISKLNVDHILIDRTPFTKGEERIVLQTVPQSIYKASYPCHIFNLNKFKDFFKSKEYSIVEEFEAVDGNKKNFNFNGLILIKNDNEETE
jgi:putative methyltransferase (TIGR04325 family)